MTANALQRRPVVTDSVSCNLAVGLLTALLFYMAGSTSAFACAGGFLQAVLFHKYPEAKSTTAAITDARESGVLQGDEWRKGSGKSLHAWRTEKTKLTIEALQTYLDSTPGLSDTFVNTNVFLLNEFSWIRIQRDGGKLTLTRQSYGSPMPEPKIFTSRRVLDELMNGGISAQQVIDGGLMTSRCGADCPSDTRSELLAIATSAPSEPVTELAQNDATDKLMNLGATAHESGGHPFSCVGNSSLCKSIELMSSLGSD